MNDQETTNAESGHTIHFSAWMKYSNKKDFCCYVMVGRKNIGTIGETTSGFRQSSLRMDESLDILQTSKEDLNAFFNGEWKEVLRRIAVRIVTVWGWESANLHIGEGLGTMYVMTLKDADNDDWEFTQVNKPTNKEEY